MIEYEGVFDLCFSRLFLYVLPEQAKFVEREYQLLKPGGYMEAHEVSGSLCDEKGAHVHEGEFLSKIYEYASKTGAVPTPGHSVSGWMKDAGFVDIEAKTHMWPHALYGASSKVQQELQDVGRGV